MVPFVSISGTLAGLHKAAKRRMRAAYRPGTRANQRCQIRSYLEFCIAHDLEYKSPTPHTLCLYAEFLAQKLTSPKSVRNYLSAISTYHNYLGLQASALSNFHYQLMLRALPLTMRHFPSQKLPITPDILFNICLVCDNLGSIGIVLKVSFTLGFFGFLRQSNLAPTSPQRFDASRHTTRSDIMIQTSGLLVRLKWSKTHQAPGIPATIPIPSLPGHCTDLLAAYHHMLRAVPTRHPNDPLLSLPNGCLITCRYLQRALCCILRALGLPATAFSLDALRRGASQAAFQAGANFVAVKQHGLWWSDAVLDYQQSHQRLTSAVPQALTRAMDIHL